MEMPDNSVGWLAGACAQSHVTWQHYWPIRYRAARGADRTSDRRITYGYTAITYQPASGLLHTVHYLICDAMYSVLMQ